MLYPHHNIRESSVASNAARNDAGGAWCGRCRNDGCEATDGTSFGAPRRPITEATIPFRAQQPDHFLWRNNRSSWANAMSSCWEEGTQWIAQAAWCRTGSSPVQQATSSATIGSSIASNFAITLRSLAGRRDVRISVSSSRQTAAPGGSATANGLHSPPSSSNVDFPALRKGGRCLKWTLPRKLNQIFHGTEWTSCRWRRTSLLARDL